MRFASTRQIREAGGRNAATRHLRAFIQCMVDEECRMLASIAIGLSAGPVKATATGE